MVNDAEWTLDRANLAERAGILNLRVCAAHELEGTIEGIDDILQRDAGRRTSELVPAIDAPVALNKTLLAKLFEDVRDKGSR